VQKSLSKGRSFVPARVLRPLRLGVGVLTLSVGCAGAPAQAEVDSGLSGQSAGESLATGGLEAGSTSSDASSDATGSADGVAADGGYPAGWLYTNGNRIYVSDGSGGGSPWMGRGVNVDDIFLCGYDNTLWMTQPDSTLKTIVSGLVSGWKPSFVRISLSMDSNPTVVSWLQNPAQY
jgi:hypothetical protein